MLLQWGASPLEDNLPTDDYHYQLSVTTGMKKNGGTASNISFIISGETCDTGVRRLFDGKRKVCVYYIGGTASNISFIISGETCDTGVRRLFDGKRKVCVNHIGASI